MASFIAERFANGTGTTTATATATVTTNHRFVVMGGGATIIVGATPGAVTCVLTTGTATLTHRAYANTTSGSCYVNFVIGDGGALEAEVAGDGDTLTLNIGKHFVAKSGETLSLVITGPTGSTGANAVLHGVDYTE